MPFNYLKAPYTPDEFHYLQNTYINRYTVVKVSPLKLRALNR